MLFLKYISDLWQDHYGTYRRQYGDDDECIRRKLDRERFTRPFVEFKDEKTAEVIGRFAGDFNSLYERRNVANIGELINIVLDVSACQPTFSPPPSFRLPFWYSTGRGKRAASANHVATAETLFRIIQSIPSPKAEPFKCWLAQVGYERVKEIEDPELVILKNQRNV